MNLPINIPEEFLQYIWENRLFNSEKLQTTNGEKLEIISLGKRNTNSGPDFFNAKIKIAETTWAGNIEIHKKASDWYKHQHEKNKAYKNVILHVVGINDKQIPLNEKETIPTLVLNYPSYLAKNYQDLLNANTWIPCSEKFHEINVITLKLGFNRLMIERLEQKTEQVIAQLKTNNDNWDETFYQLLARMFGFKVNALPFELLAKAVPAQLLAKHKNNLFQLEALLFGSSGLLHEQVIGDEYFLKLREEYLFLQKKYKLKSIETHLWKFMRLRPMNFPTIRISQFAALVYNSNNLFSKILEIDTIDQLKKLFHVKASEYWDTHYRFNKPTSKKSGKELGEGSIHILIINIIIPFLFVYGDKMNKHELKDRALNFLEQLPAEKNAIINKWKDLGIQAQSSFDSQALLQLKKYYCETKKCLNCHVGIKLVSSPENLNHK